MSVLVVVRSGAERAEAAPRKRGPPARARAPACFVALGGGEARAQAHGRVRVPPLARPAPSRRSTAQG